MFERLALHDVADAEAFVASIVERSGLSLPWHEREDLEAYLLAEAWRLSERYEPGGQASRFGFYAKQILSLRVVDWTRLRFGRTRWKFANSVYERPRLSTVPLDDDVDRDCLEWSLGEGNGDLEIGWDPALGGILGDGDRPQAQDLRTLGLRPRRRAAG